MTKVESLKSSDFLSLFTKVLLLTIPGSNPGSHLAFSCHVCSVLQSVIVYYDT